MNIKDLPEEESDAIILAFADQNSDQYDRMSVVQMFAKQQILVFENHDHAFNFLMWEWYTSDNERMSAVFRASTKQLLAEYEKGYGTIAEVIVADTENFSTLLANDRVYYTFLLD